MSLVLQNDDVVALTLKFTKNGKEVAGPTDVAAWTLSDPVVAALDTAAGPTVTLTPTVNGDEVVSVAVGGLTASLAVSIVDPAADAVEIVAGTPTPKV